MKQITIPEKTFFKIGEVSKLLDLEPYVLRYWETEFDGLKPEKTRSGQRAYRRTDIELLLLIRDLLYEEMYTISGARRQLKLRKKRQQEPDPRIELETARERIAVLESEVDPLKTALKPLTQQLEATAKENRAVKAAYAELERKFVAHKDAVADLAESSVAEDAEAQKSLEESRRIVGKQAAENAKLQRELTEAKDALDAELNKQTALDNQLTLLASSTVSVDEFQALEERLKDAAKTIEQLSADKESADQVVGAKSQTQLRQLLSLRRELETMARLVN